MFSLSLKSPEKTQNNGKPDPLSHWAVQDYLFGWAKQLDCWKMLYRLVIACAMRQYLFMCGKQQLNVFVVINIHPCRSLAQLRVFVVIPYMYIDFTNCMSNSAKIPLCQTRTHHNLAWITMNNAGGVDILILITTHQLQLTLHRRL